MSDSRVPVDIQKDGDALSAPAPLKPLQELLLWLDPVARSGAEAMAADEAMLELCGKSVLRVYRWGRPTVTYGFFDREETARAAYSSPELEYVRRWTGGGIVDHRRDIPFTLALLQPKGEPRPDSAALYRWIHGTLARVLRDCGADCIMLTEDAPNGGRSCFSSPVTSDLVTSAGDKLAGGGQRRTRRGVLHQGSIQNCSLPEGWGSLLAGRMADNVEVSCAPEPFEGLNRRIAELLAARYETEAWKKGSRHAAR